VRLQLDMGGDLAGDVRSLFRIDGTPWGSRAASACRARKPGHVLALTGRLGVVRAGGTR